MMEKRNSPIALIATIKQIVLIVLINFNIIMFINATTTTTTVSYPNIHKNQSTLLFDTTIASNDKSYQTKNISINNDHQQPTQLYNLTSKSIKSGKRQGRFSGSGSSSSLLDDSDYHRQPNDSETNTYSSDSQEPTKAGIAQMYRAARNAKTKMKFIDSRVDQINNIIDENHRQPDNNSNLETGSSSENNYDLALDSQNQNSGNNNNIESTNQNEQNKWSTSVPTESDGSDLSHNFGDTIKNKSSPLIDNSEWSPPVNQIKSVIPARQNMVPISRADNNNENNEQIRRDSLDGDQSTNNEQDNNINELNSNKMLLSKQSDDYNQTINNNNNYNDQMSSYSETHLNHTNDNNRYNTPISNEPATASSMLGSEWSPNQNYQFFSELNAKNHNGNANKQHSYKSSSLIKATNNNNNNDINNNNNGAVAFRPSSHNPNKGNKFHDMTVVNSETDLLNSFSTHQQHSLPEISVPYSLTTSSPSIRGPLSTTTSTTTTTTKKPEQFNNNRRTNSIFTYTASNYGKSSKDQARNLIPITTQPTMMQPVDSYESRAQAGNDMMSSSQTNYEPTNTINDTNRYFHEQTIQWPQFASSYSNNQNHQADYQNQRYANQQGQQMLTQESGHSETIQPKTSTPDEDNNLISIDNNQALANNYQQGVTNINRQLNLQEVDNNNNIPTDQSAYNYQQRPNINSQMDDISQESNNEPTYHKNRLYYATSGHNNNNNLDNLINRQQQLSRMAAAIVANNPSLNNVDIESLVHKYQQHQRKLASQLNQQQTKNRPQQQQVDMPLESSSAYVNSYNPSSISRAFYTTTPGEQQQTIPSHSVNKRYSPEMQLSSYLNNRAIQQQQQQQQVAYATGPDNTFSDSIQLSSDLIPYTTTSPQYQPLYSNYDGNIYLNSNTNNNNNNNNNRALKAYYKALMSSAAAATNPTTKSLFDNNQAYSFYQPQTLPSLYSNNNNYSSGGGAGTAALYATAAMNNPSYYDSLTGRQPTTDSYSTSATTTNNIMSNNQQLDLNGAGSATTIQQQQATQTSGLLNANNQQSNSQASTAPQGGATYKRGYLNSLFKPAASSRYYYTPTILSPISLASPTTVHSLYAPATIATAETLPSIYAATNPYSYIAAQHPSAVDQTAQYQAFAAAANSLQPHYMDPDMAESSLVASDSQSTGAISNESDNNNNNGNSNNSKSNGKGMGPWTNIAGLLLGILPFGILMASLLPAVTVAGRKKRELDFIGARNFSDLLNWRAPSKVLNALIAQQNSSGLSLTNASDIINEQLASFTSKKHNFVAPPTYSRRRSLSNSGGSTSVSGFLDRLIQSGDRSSNSLVYNSTPTIENSLFSVSNGTNFNTTVGNNGTNGVKAKVKKALSALNNFITAAQNMKRKHRSSMIENQWNIPLMFKNLLRFDNIFSFDEFKRQLASVAHTGVILAQQKQQLQQQQQQNKNNDNSKEIFKENTYQQSKNNSTISRLSDKTSLSINSNDTNQQLTTSIPLMSMNVTDGDELNNNYINRAQVGSPLGKDLETAASSFKKQLEYQPVTKEYYYSPATHLNSPLNKHVESLINQKQEDFQVKSQPEAMDNSTKRHLEVCLNQFLCRLTVKLNKSLRNSLTSTNESQQSLSTQQNNNKSSIKQPNPDQLERITKKYINQLIEQIEAENPTVLSNLQSNSNKTGYNNNGTETQIKNNGLDLLYANAMKNQCSSMYNCIELNQLEKTLSKMKLKFS